LAHKLVKLCPSIGSVFFEFSLYDSESSLGRLGRP
jgi:hypothetical protein